MSAVRRGRAYLHPGPLALVFLGGTAGTASREALSLLWPEVHGIPFTILAINLSGAFLLGLLLEALARSGPDAGWRQRFRLLLGTGFMGGFTTYSTLATGAAGLLLEGRTLLGLSYGLGTVLFGALATWAGIALGTRISHRRRLRPDSVRASTTDPEVDAR